MGSLYEAGWRQGGLLRHRLPATWLEWSEGNGIVQRGTEHELWVVATQDCDLDALDEADNRPLVELRPVYDDGRSRQLGIRSRELRLQPSSTMFIHAQSPRVVISPAALSACLQERGGSPADALTPDEALKLKTWLGRRYDRPAVPPEVVDLGRAIAAAVKGHRVGDVAAQVRDVLWQFEPGEPPLFSLYAVVEGEGIRDQAREWLTKVGLSVPMELGVPVVMEAATAERISLRLIETSYSADVSDLTWGRGEPRGAF